MVNYASLLTYSLSTVQINILPQINVISSMIPLPPPPDYWDKLTEIIRKFPYTEIYMGKETPQIKYSTIQRAKLKGGLALPNFKLYHCFQATPLNRSLCYMEQS